MFQVWQMFYKIWPVSATPIGYVLKETLNHNNQSRAD